VIRNSSFAICEAVGDEGVEVGMKVEVFAEGVEGEDEGGLGVGQAEGGAEVPGPVRK